MVIVVVIKHRVSESEKVALKLLPIYFSTNINEQLLYGSKTHTIPKRKAKRE